MGSESPQKADVKHGNVSGAVSSMKGANGEINLNKKFLEETRSINFALVLDPAGPYKEMIPTVRDAETHKQMYMELRYKAMEVPPDQVLYYTGTPIQDFNTTKGNPSTHSATVDVNGQREAVIFDRTFAHAKKVFNQCAWVPNVVIRAGLVYEKKVNQRTKQPIAVLRRMGSLDSTPKYRLVAGKEADYRDLRRVFERAFIKKAGAGTEDDELDRWLHQVIEPIEQEIDRSEAR